MTGFDAPRNTILYIAKKLQDHNLLQAVARVNRPFEGKDFGYIIDYRGVIGHLSHTLSVYSSLSAFEQEDIRDTFQPVEEELAKLPQRHSDLWSIFKTVENKNDKESLERFLADEAIRHDFYDRLSTYARTLQTAMASDRFYRQTSEEHQKQYNDDLRFFEQLRQSVRQRYAETLDFKEYEKRIQKLMDTHVSVDRVVTITGTVNIFDKKAFDKAVALLSGTTASKADWIAHQVRRTLNEHMDEDRARYQRFSDMIEEVISAFHQKRISEASYFQQTRNIYAELVGDSSDQTPRVLYGNPEARAYYGAISQILNNRETDILSAGVNDEIAQAGVDINALVDELKIVDWKNNPDIEKQMHNVIEDRLLVLSDAVQLHLTFDEIDLILDQAMRIARSHG